MEVLSPVRKTEPLAAPDVRELVARACPLDSHRNKRVLLIVPDATRTGPVDLFVQALHEQLASVTAAFDVMVALGTHQPMSEGVICARLGISLDERRDRYRNVRLDNHEWQNPRMLVSLGTIPADEICSLSGGLFAIDVEVRVNRRLFDYDRLIIVGPVFPHEVVGFSGGNKYLFPGVSGPEVLNFFHWLGAVVTNPRIIGSQSTPVRKVIDRAASMLGVTKFCFCLVVQGTELAGVFAGTPEAAWTRASELSRQLHIIYKERPFSTILSCAPKIYEDL
jgi:nickel-dependent lactate racemase